MHVCCQQILKGVEDMAAQGAPGASSKVAKQARALQNLIGATIQAIGGGEEEPA